MKLQLITNKLLIASAITFSALGFSGCSKSNSSPSSTSSTTTTQTTPFFTADVNSSSASTFTGLATTAGTSLNLDGQNSSVQIVLYLPSAGAGTYTLSTTNTATVFSGVGSSQVRYTTDATHTGTITFTTYTTGNPSGQNVVAGTFSFVANETNPTAGAAQENVTNGSFYVKY